MPFDLGRNWCAMSSVARTTFLPGASATFSLSSYWWRDVIALTFDLWGHRPRRWCGSPYSIRMPSFKFVGLPVLKIWVIFDQGVNRPSDLDLWPFDLQMMSQVIRVMGFLPANFQLAMPFHSQLRVRHGTDRQTERQTDRQTDRETTTINAL